MLISLVRIFTQARMGVDRVIFLRKGPMRGQYVFLTAKYVLFMDVFYFQSYKILGFAGNRSFRIQVISYPSHFVPFWSFRTHFYFQFGHFVPSLVISYPFRTQFGHFVPASVIFSKTVLVISYLFCTVSYPSHFVPILVISCPGHFVPTSKLGTN